jgi:hypothetical protein
VAVHVEDGDCFAAPGVQRDGDRSVQAHPRRCLLESGPLQGRVDIGYADRAAGVEGGEARAGVVGVLSVVDRPDQVVRMFRGVARRC